LKTQVRATMSLIDGLHFQGKDEKDNTIELDSAAAGNLQAGFKPMELVLQALCGCSGMDSVFILNKRKLKPEKFEIEVTGIKRDEHPRIFEEINVVYKTKGEGITLKELERAVSLSMDKYCSVSAMLRGVVKINWRCELIE